MSKTEKLKSSLESQFDSIQSQTAKYDISQYQATMEDLPDLGEIEIYDYDSDLIVVNKDSTGVLESLVDLYLGDVPMIKEHPYIKNKMREDAMVYSDIKFISKMSRKSLLSQMRQVDNGDNSTRMHEVINQTITQIRENSKFAATQRTELEKFYKSLRKDLDSIDSPDVQKAFKDMNDTKEDAKEEGGALLDNRRFNEMIKAAMNKDKK